MKTYFGLALIGIALVSHAAVLLLSTATTGHLISLGAAAVVGALGVLLIAEDGRR